MLSAARASSARKAASRRASRSAAALRRCSSALRSSSRASVASTHEGEGGDSTGDGCVEGVDNADDDDDDDEHEHVVEGAVGGGGGGGSAAGSENGIGRSTHRGMRDPGSVAMWLRRGRARARASGI